MSERDAATTPKPGRPTKLDDLRAKRVCDAIGKGNTRRCAAQAGGVSPSTLKDWLRRGRAGEEPFSDFLARVKKAEAEAEAAAVKIVLDAARSGTWQAAAWFLERRHRAWRRPPSEPYDRAHAAAVPAQFEHVSADALIAKIERAAAAMRTEDETRGGTT